MRSLCLLALAAVALSVPVVALSGANDGYVACTTSETCVPSDVRLSVHDVNGRLVAVLEDGERAAGGHEVIWLGTDASGDDVATGVYFFRLTTVDGSTTTKAALLK